MRASDDIARGEFTEPVLVLGEQLAALLAGMNGSSSGSGFIHGLILPRRGVTVIIPRARLLVGGEEHQAAEGVVHMGESALGVDILTP